MVAMAVGDIAIDPLSLQDFAQQIQPRLDQANAALLTLLTSPGADQPALGAFYDAQVTEDRHKMLHDQYVQRLQRLIDALNAASTSITTMLDRYHTIAGLQSAHTFDIRAALEPVSEALNGHRNHA
jgi:hypothetical protein